jgi:hypothetical protein
MDYFAGHPAPRRPEEGGLTRRANSPNLVFQLPIRRQDHATQNLHHRRRGGHGRRAAPWLRAQNLPTGPVRIIVGFAPGGGTDILARVIGQKLGDMWNTQVIVENKAAPPGTIAADYVAKQPGDGTLLHMAHINSHAHHARPAEAGLRPEKDFQPISWWASRPTC